MRRAILGGALDVAAIALAMIYLLALLPVMFLGLAATVDFQSRGCPGAVQCSDATFVKNVALGYILAAPLTWLLFKALRAAARAVRRKTGPAPD